MKIKNILTTSAALALLFFSACDKDHDNHDEDDTSKPVAIITSPTDLAVFTNGDTIRIKGKLEDNELHEAVVSLMDDTTNAVLFSYTPYAHDKTVVTIDTFWKASVIKNTKATLLFQAMDHADNIGTANRKITINK
jgi:hypothetical protein